MKKLLALALVLVLVTGALGGCAVASSSSAAAPSAGQSAAQSTEPAQSTQPAAQEGGMTAMIVVIPQGDPFLTLAYSGVTKYAEEVGKDAKIIEALDKSEYSEQIRAMAEAGADPIYVVWDDLAEEAFKIAPEFPDTHFIVVDSYATSDEPNVETIVVEPEEAAFIAGWLAAGKSESGQVAWVGNMDMPTANRWRYGFEAGVEYADLGVTCESVYIGDSNDPNKGAELTKQVIDKGADVVMQTANQAGLGVIRACEEMGVLAIGCDEWQGYINEETVFWSALKDIAGATYAAGKSVSDGSFAGGIVTYGVDSGAVLYDDRDYTRLPDDLKTGVDEIVQKIAAGEIEVPGTAEG